MIRFINKTSNNEMISVALFMYMYTCFLGWECVASDKGDLMKRHRERQRENREREREKRGGGAERQRASIFQKYTFSTKFGGQHLIYIAIL